MPEEFTQQPSARDEAILVPLGVKAGGASKLIG
jgi:hypothetical protein